MWAYVIYSDGIQYKKAYIQKNRLVKINKTKKKCIINKNDGKCNKGIILAEEDTKEKLKALVTKRKFRIAKYCYQLRSNKVKSSMACAESLFGPKELKKNWKKRLLSLAAQESEECQPVTTENTTSEIHPSYVALPGEVSNTQLLDEIDKYQEEEWNKLYNNQSNVKASEEVSSDSKLTDQMSVDDTDSGDSIWTQKKKTLEEKLFSPFNKRAKRLSSWTFDVDSESSLSSSDEELYNRYRQIDPNCRKFMSDMLKLKQIEQLKKLRKIKSKSRGRTSFRTTKKTVDTKTSSDRKKYIQFCVTHVYSPMAYSEALRKILHEKGVNDTMEVLDSSVIEYISSNTPLLHSTANITVFESDVMPKEESFNAGVNHDLLKLRENFHEFKQQVLSLLQENNQRLEELNGDLQIFKQNKNLEIQEVIKNALPSKSLEEFLKFNNLLKESPPHREELKKMYQVIICGETSIKSCIRKVMKFTLSSAVESEYSGVGKKFRGVTKRNYSQTQTFECLHDILVDKFGLIPELKNLGARVGQWLSSSTAEREGVRKKKTDR